MVDFAKALADLRALKESGEQFVGYCKICDIDSKIYECHIVRLADNDKSEHDLFKCPKCKACQERDDMIPF